MEALVASNAYSCRGACRAIRRAGQAFAIIEELTGITSWNRLFLIVQNPAIFGFDASVTVFTDCTASEARNASFGSLVHVELEVAEGLACSSLEDSSFNAGDAGGAGSARCAGAIAIATERIAGFELSFGAGLDALVDRQ